MTPWGSVVNTIHAYRLHVILIFTALLYLYSVPTLVTSGYQGNYLVTLSAFMIYWAAFYIGNKYFDFEEDSVSQPSEARRGVGLRNLTLVLYGLPVLLLAVIGQPLVPYLFLAFLSIWYSAPLPGTNVRFKSLTLIKNVYAAGVWWFSVASFLYFYVGTGEDLFYVLKHTSGMFFILMAIELLWDIRDTNGDRVAGNQTVPVVFGIVATKLLIGVVLALIILSSPELNNFYVILNVVYLSTVTLTARVDFNPIFFHGIIYVETLIILAQILLLSFLLV